jgi:uncharacterized protein YijF (DUF1287 family)
VLGLKLRRVITRRAAVALLAATTACARASPTPPPELVAAARRQIGVTTAYDAGYHPIAYPGGDLPRSTGACTDVVIRAARDAWGVDLQRLVHEDMARAFAAYPRHPGVAGPDPNIDHRRVPNLVVYLTRAGAGIWRESSAGPAFGYLKVLAPGDLLTWRRFVAGGTHIAIVSEVAGGPRLVQNYGWGVHEELLLPPFVTGVGAVFRWRPELVPGVTRRLA